MKKNKKYISIITILSLTLIPEIVKATDYIKCGNDKKILFGIANISSIVLTIIKIIVPVTLVISGMISFFKASIATNVDDELKKAKSKLINNIIAAVIVFMIFPITKTFVTFIAGTGNEFMECTNCLFYPETCELVSEDDDLKPGLMIDQENDSNNDSSENTDTNQQKK